MNGETVEWWRGREGLSGPLRGAQPEVLAWPRAQRLAHLPFPGLHPNLLTGIFLHAVASSACQALSRAPPAQADGQA